MLIVVSIAAVRPAIAATPAGIAVTRVVAVSPELRRDLADLALRMGYHCPVVRRFLDFVRRPRLREFFLELVERVRPYGATLTAEHHKPHRPIEIGNLLLDERASDFLW